MLLFLLGLGCSTSEPEPVVPKKSGRHAPSKLDQATRAAASSELDEKAGPGEVKNRPPIVRSVQMKPAVPSKIETLTATVDAIDPDDQPVTLEYDWLVNGRAVPRARKPSLALGDYSRGDKVILRVTATDYIETTVVDSDEVEIANAPPVIQTNPGRLKTLDGLAIVAVDPDDDAITWAVENGPPTLSIDSGGVLHWQGSETDPGGEYRVKVIASDSFEGKATLELPLSIAPGKPKEVPKRK